MLTRILETSLEGLKGKLWNGIPCQWLPLGSLVEMFWETKSKNSHIEHPLSDTLVL